jgi:hypothetical protein
MTQASKPHVLCSAHNLYLDTSKFSKARCPRLRPGFLCLSPTYNHYASGAFGLACSLPTLSLGHFPKDHLRDIMASLKAFDTADLPKVL